ncbi:MAG: GT4 family glycosyltransferase PelF [Planctomycetota bacterium]
MSNDDRAEIVLLLEGTYPFVMGGVSSWVHRLISEMPERTFGLVHIAPQVDYYGSDPAYKMPENVLFLEQCGLMPPTGGEPTMPDRRHEQRLREVWAGLLQIRAGTMHQLQCIATLFVELAEEGLRPDDVLSSQPCWDALVECYEREDQRQSFLNFYWTWMFAWRPLVELLFHRVPRAGMYHTVSTGYAGLLAALASAQWQRPMILTEHGIYTKERRIEIYSANWIQDGEHEDYVVDREAPYFRQFWNQHFEAMSRCCYEQSSRIFTLYADNKAAQIADGADPDKIDIVPNGVDVASLTAAFEHAQPRAADSPFTVAFVGRVTPIKDVRTVLAAMRLLARDVPNLLVRILGPMNEDPDYAEGCLTFAKDLGLDDVVRFEGAVNVRQELVKCDVLLLTSISEAQPLVILEAGALGVPVVATDVGSCRELLEGRTAADRSIGTGGILTAIASPGEVACAVRELHDDGELRLRMGRSLQRRVRELYDESEMIGAYRSVYLYWLKEAGVDVSPIEGAAATPGEASNGEDEPVVEKPAKETV